jgi:hypothetical protein
LLIFFLIRGISIPIHRTEIQASLRCLRSMKRRQDRPRRCAWPSAQEG